jgi:hypothetical protein
MQNINVAYQKTYNKIKFYNFAWYQIFKHNKQKFKFQAIMGKNKLSFQLNIDIEWKRLSLGFRWKE